MGFSSDRSIQHRRCRCTRSARHPVPRRPLPHGGYVLLAVYPLVTALIYIIFPLTEGWQAWQRTLS